MGIINRMSSQFEVKRVENELLEQDIIQKQEYYDKNAVKIIGNRKVGEIRDLRLEAKKLETVSKQHQIVVDLKQSKMHKSTLPIYE